MPRSKFVPSKYTLLYSQLGYFKVEYPDFIFDFHMIYEDIIKFFSETNFKDYDEYTQIKAKSELTKRANIKPQLENRFYIITSYDEPVLAVVNMDNAVVQNLVETYDPSSFLLSDFPKALSGSYISTLYVFKGSEMLINTRISPFQMAHLMAAFKNENLVNYQGVRDSLYGEPRRRQKRKLSDLSDEVT